MISETGNNLIGTVTAKSNISAWNYMLSGKINLALESSLESVRLAEDSGDIYAKGVAYGSHGLSCFCKGLLDQAKKNLQNGMAFCGKIRQLSWGGCDAIVVRSALY